MGCSCWPCSSSTSSRTGLDAASELLMLALLLAHSCVPPRCTAPAPPMPQPVHPAPTRHPSFTHVCWKLVCCCGLLLRPRLAHPHAAPSPHTPSCAAHCCVDRCSCAVSVGQPATPGLVAGKEPQDSFARQGCFQGPPRGGAHRLRRPALIMQMCWMCSKTQGYHFSATGTT